MNFLKRLYVTELGGGWKGIYNPIGHKIAFLNYEDWTLLSERNYEQVDENLIDFLKTNNFLVNEGFEDNWLSSLYVKPSVKIDSMYLIVTTECNLACKYCVVLSNKPSPVSVKMTEEVGFAALREFEKHLQQAQPSSARITFYGGEPMLNKKLITTLLPKIREISYPNMSKPLEIVMITNGLIYDSTMTELFKKYSVDIAISLDGKKEQNDLARIDLAGNGTFERIMTNYKKYQESGINLTISTTLGLHNLSSLPELADFYNVLLPGAVEFQLPCRVPNDSNPFWILPSKAVDSLMEAYKALLAKGIVEYSIHRKMLSFKNGHARLRDCGSSGSQIVIAPDGTIGPCHSLVGAGVFFESSVLSSDCDFTQLHNLIEWSERFPLNMDDCKECCFISFCGGGCIYDAFIANGSIWRKDSEHCNYIRLFVDKVIKDIWSKVYCT